ncbi:MAG: hypothetical protein JW793_04815 [Acidobacteria bacterium]|nr:hypothetical protein [Acidobacteriota bacterium]
MASDSKRERNPAVGPRPGKIPSRARSDGRRRFYTALLVFVVAVGLPIVAVPSFRNLLAARVASIRAAIGGGVDPVTVQIGDESPPFPEEYDRQATLFPGPDQTLPMDRIFTARTEDPGAPAGFPPPLFSPEASSAGKPVPDAEAETPPPEPGAAESDSDNGLGYSQGDAEREAYALVLQSYPEVAEMVEGKDPALRFLSWGAVKRGEDLYWVRLVFQNEENAEVEYIWRVEPGSKRILPLSFNARSIL